MGPISARGASLKSLNAKRLEIAKHRESSERARNSTSNARRATDTSAPSGVKNITFSNPRASGAYAWVHALLLSSSHAFTEFWVNGSAIPEVNFDIGSSWSGLIPIPPYYSTVFALGKFAKSVGQRWEIRPNSLEARRLIGAPSQNGRCS
jgi:hypothetical protein